MNQMFKIQNYHWIKKMKARHEALSINHQDTHYNPIASLTYMTSQTYVLTLE